MGTKVVRQWVSLAYKRERKTVRCPFLGPRQRGEADAAAEAYDSPRNQPQGQRPRICQVHRTNGSGGASLTEAPHRGHEHRDGR